MKKVQSVSIPRTGHHLLVNCLTRYFDDFKYCNFYGCCKELNCPLNADFQKNHDIAMHGNIHETEVMPYLPTDMDMPYIIQYRKDAQSTLNAMYRNLRMKGIFGRNERVPEDELKKFLEKEVEEFKSFCNEKRDYYHGFIQKWLIYNNNPQAYFLEYYDFLNRPAHHLENIIKIFDPDKYDEIKLKEVLDVMDIRLRHNLIECPLYLRKFNQRMGFADPPKK